MRVYIEENVLVIKEPKNFNLELSKDVSKNLNSHEIEFIIKRNETFAEYKIKNKIMTNYCTNISMEIIFMNIENSKTSEQQQRVLNLSQRLDLRSSKKDFAL